MATFVLDIHIEVPGTVSETATRIAVDRAREAAIIALQQEGEMTIREAAEGLGLCYEDYLDLLASRGLPFARSAAQDPLLQLAGALDSDVADAAERHDEYLGQTLRRRLRQNVDA